jgi:glutaredoxin
MPKALVYTRLKHCPYCEKAKALLTEHNIDIEAIVVGQDIEPARFIADVKEKTGVTVDTVPQIFLDGDYIGGYDDLAALPEFAPDIDFGDIEL